MARQSTTITTLPRSPEDDRHARMVRYSITMGIRLVCIALCLVVHGWWLLLCAAGAVFLPYIAVILANVVVSKTGTVERPEVAPRMIAAPILDVASDKEQEHTL